MKQEQFIRVAVASDQDIYRRGLVSLITSLSQTRLVGEARDETEALQLCEMLEPDILLLDIKNLPEGGRELLRGVHHRWPGIKVVFLQTSLEENQDSDGPEDEEVIYFSKDISEDEFGTALMDIHRNLQRDARVRKPAQPLLQLRQKRQSPSRCLPGRGKPPMKDASAN
jgi:DNA-binding NarL/FixJ family response regulator